jgi:predicted AAA+ superfamily ATPase
LFTLISAQTSGEYIQSKAASRVQIPESSLHGYVRLLHDLFLIHELPAWGRNLSERIVGRKKLSIADTGLASFLNGIDSQALADVMNGETFDPIFESFAVSELFKQKTWSDMDYALYHFRNRDKKEVDIVIELRDGRIIGLEIKSAKSVSSKDFQGMKALRELAGARFLCGIVLYTGHETQTYGGDMYFAPLSAIWANYPHPPAPRRPRRSSKSSK